MNYLRVREAALRYDLSEKTIRNWIKARRLPYQMQKVKGIEQYMLDPGDIERVIAEQNISPDSTTTLAELESRLAQMEQEMEVLRSRIDTLEQTQVEYKMKGTKTRTPRSPLPTGWYPWTPFIERHAVSAERRQLMRLNKSDYCQPGEYMQSSAKGKTLVKYALDLAGQGHLLSTLWNTEFQRDLRQCDVGTCPCHEIFQSPDI